MHRSELDTSTHYWFRNYSDYRVQVLDLAPYNIQASNGWYNTGPVLAKSKTAKGVLVRYLDKDTGKPNQAKDGVVNIDRIRGPWDSYLEKNKEKLEVEKRYREERAQRQFENERMNRVTEKLNVQLTGSAPAVKLMLHDWRTQQFSFVVTGEDVARFLVETICEAVTADA